MAELRRLRLAGPLNLRPAFGFDWEDLQDIHSPGGLFLFPLADGRQAVAWIFAGTSTDDTGPLAVAARYFGEQGFRGETLQRGRGQLTVLHPADPQRGGSSPVLFASPGYYGVANSLSAAEAVLAVAAEKSLAAEPAWQQATPAETTAAPRPGDVTLLLRPLQLWELVRSEGERRAPAEQPATADKTEKPADAEPPRDPLAASRQLGFDGVQALAARVTFSAEPLADWQIQRESHRAAPVRQSAADARDARRPHAATSGRPERRSHQRHVLAVGLSCGHAGLWQPV